MANERLARFWGDPTEAPRTGQPRDESRTTPDAGPFDALYRDPTRLRLFLQGMTGLSLGSARAIAQRFPWQDHGTFVNVGGALGALPVQVALAHPHLTGGNFDLPVVARVFEEYVASFGLQDRLRFVPGDSFTDPLPAADVLVMGHILHDRDLDQKRRSIAKAYQALPAGGALIIYESLIDDQWRSNAFGLLMSRDMPIKAPGGFDHAGADGSRWLEEAGFRQTRVEHLLGPDTMVVGVK